MEKTKVTWADHKSLIVETPCGDDFLIGFWDDTNFRIEHQSVFKYSLDLAKLFDHFYKGDSSIIIGEINRILVQHCYRSISYFQPYEKTLKDDERIRIGQRIKEIRLEKGIDAKTLAAISGIDAGNLCRIEAGKYSVGFDILTKIASVCGKKLDFIDVEDNTHECIINDRS